MNRKIIEAIKKVIKDQNIKANIDENNIDAQLKELGIDSLSSMGIIVGVEEILDVRIPDDQLLSLKTVRNLIEAFDKQLNSK